ncbi:MAG: LysE family translocator [Methylocystaceae bacterium]|nr:MAG: LysE family translocator [Methylocystaceae bacterium]
MTAASLFIYAGALTLAAATPGPAIFSIVTTAITRGWRSVAALALGVAIGDVPLAMFVLLGLSFLAQSLGWLFMVIKFAGAAYLIWLGLKLWISSKADALVSSEIAGTGRIRHFFMGLGISLGNPKAIFFHAGMMPLLLDLHHVTTSNALTVALIILCVDLSVCFTYAAVGVRARGFFRTARRLQFMNRAAGSAMIGTGILVASQP